MVDPESIGLGQYARKCRQARSKWLTATTVLEMIRLLWPLPPDETRDLAEQDIAVRCRREAQFSGNSEFDNLKGGLVDIGA